MIFKFFSLVIFEISFICFFFWVKVGICYRLSFNIECFINGDVSWVLKVG